MSRYIQRKDGDGWAIKNGEIFRLACCDCGLVHDMVITVSKLRRGTMLGIAAKRNNRATARKRAGRG